MVSTTTSPGNDSMWFCVLFLVTYKIKSYKYNNMNLLNLFVFAECIDKEYWCALADPNCQLGFVKERCKKQCNLCEGIIQ